VFGALGCLTDGRGVQGVADQDLRPSGFERCRLHRIAHEDPELMPAVDQLVGDSTAEKAGRSKQENPGHGSES
jgi:hypothetical protein